MAGETGPRCSSTHRKWEKKPRTIIALLFPFFLLLVVFPTLLYHPMEPAPTINVGKMESNPVEPTPLMNACRDGRKERGCVQAVPRRQHVQGTRSNSRRLSSDLNQFHVPAVASPGRHARRSPPSSSTTSGRYSASAHEVVSGPNPRRNG